MTKRLIALTISGIISVLCVTSCSKTENPEFSDSTSLSDANSDNDSSVGSSTDNSTDNTGEDNSAQKKDVYIPTPPNDTTEKEEVTGNHYILDGNTIYNNNGTFMDDYRYYADFVKSDEPTVLWYGSNDGKEPEESFNAEAALEYAYYHWDDGVGLCAPFISACMEAGEISPYSSSSTGLCLQLLNSGLGFGQFLPINEDRTVTLPEYARRGDVIQAYCPYEGMMIHSLMFNGNDSDGNMMVYCHNFRNNGTTTFHIDDLCYDCDKFVDEVFYFHFYNEDDKNLPELLTKDNAEVLLFEESGYALPETYDREKAVAYAKNNPDDGLGMYGAQHLSECLKAGGISVYYNHNSALLFQLMRSHLGTAFSLKVNNNRTVTLPDYAEPGDVCFIYCPYDGVMISSFIIAGRDDQGNMLAYSFDDTNTDATKPFRVDSYCVGCGTDIEEVVFYHFN